MKKKDFDAVEMMRKIRDKHHEEYTNNPELRHKRLSEIREKYNIKKRSEKSVNR
ncbi:MAG: hypothetical protein KGY69_03865 [Bacteroidales bacterium]|nr:hypothetical protein [Bacteroidales bacterium]